MMSELNETVCGMSFVLQTNCQFVIHIDGFTPEQ